MKRSNNLLATMALAAAVSSLAVLHASAEINYNTAFDGSGAPGNFTSGAYNNIGLSFQPQANVTINSLGAFDAGGNGWGTGNVNVGLYNVANGNLLASVLFNGSEQGTGTLVGGYRYQSISSITLESGSIYAVVATGMGNSTVPAYKKPSSTASAIVPNTFDDAIIYLSSYGNAGALPEMNEFIQSTYRIGGATAYGAASFGGLLSPVPEAKSFALAGVGVLGLVFVGRRLVMRRAV